MRRSLTLCAMILAAVIVTGTPLAGQAAPAHARVAHTTQGLSGGLRATIVVGGAASAGCPSSWISNGYIIDTKGLRGQYAPAQLWGGVGTSTTASVCIKNVSGVTRWMTGCVATPLKLVPGATAALTGLAVGLYACGLILNPTAQVLIHVI